MAYALLWWPDADASLTRLECDPTMNVALKAVRRTLGRLERDPYDPRRLTRQFFSDALGHIRVTPAGEGDWYVFWQLGDEPNTIEIVQIAEVPL